MKSITVEELANLQESFSDKDVILDVRSNTEFMSGHINAKNIQNIDINSLLARAQELKSKNIYVICQTGSRSQIAQMLLSTVGISSTNVRGGTSAWLNKYPEKIAYDK